MISCGLFVVDDGNIIVIILFVVVFVDASVCLLNDLRCLTIGFSSLKYNIFVVLVVISWFNDLLLNELIFINNLKKEIKNRFNMKLLWNTYR